MQIYKKISRLFFKPLESQNRRQNFKIHKHVGEHWKKTFFSDFWFEFLQHNTRFIQSLGKLEFLINKKNRRKLINRNISKRAVYLSTHKSTGVQPAAKENYCNLKFNHWFNCQIIIHLKFAKRWMKTKFVFPAAVQGLLLWKYFDPMITIWCYKFTFYVLSQNTEMVFCFVFYLMRYFSDTCCILFSGQSHCYHMKSRNKVIINW